MHAQLQSEAAECSLACLAMVASAHGLRLDLAELRRRFPVSLKGANLQQLMVHAAALGFSSRPLRLEMSELRQLQLPCVLHWDLNHFVVLKRVNRRGAVVLDPAVGERRLPLAQVSRHFTGVALELFPNATFQPADQRQRLKLSQLTGRVRGLNRSLLQILAVALVLELFAVVAPLFNQLVVDEVITSHDADLLTVLALGFGLLLVAQTGIGLARSWMVMVLGQTLSLQWLGNMFAHLVRLPLDYFEKRHLGDVVSRFGSVTAIQKTLTTNVIEAVLDGVMALAALTMMLLYAPQLAAVTVTAVLLYTLLRWASYRPLREAAAERLVVASRENTHFLETLRAITPLKLFGREEARRAGWQNLIVDVQNRDVRTARMNIGFAAASTFIFGTENLVVFWLGARLVMQGQSTQAVAFTVGMMFAFASYKGQFTSRVSALVNYAIELKMLSLHAERLGDIALTAPETDELPESDLSHLPASLELRNVSFRYGEGEPWLLKNANFKVEAGQSVALTGPSGCGKTTLLKLMLGLLPPTEGEVLYGGVPIRQLGIANVRRRIGTVMQEDVLLTGSLADNISFFDPRPSSQRAEVCARLAQLHADIMKMPMGYHTLVGDLGSGLSGGQKQRLLLARALYKQPSVLALDEATSHLDAGNERAVTLTLGGMRLTRLVIAHRPETIAGAQRVVQIRDGQVAELMQAVPRPAQPTAPMPA
ncbi:peptidase domain-containing ABC transporter [Methylibium rhizosphaerae]|uniref:peptidase domain-containing ABC transporter n=1 Tax=Methylibium rhizosphaerae TaxID=2570323 RepID=UPI00112CFEE1|nr:peptidase domain-containing ABC transporter [Methylibium rhizosphaerae]